MLNENTILINSEVKQKALIIAEEHNQTINETIELAILHMYKYYLAEKRLKKLLKILKKGLQLKRYKFIFLIILILSISLLFYNSTTFAAPTPHPGRSKQASVITTVH